MLQADAVFCILFYISILVFSTCILYLYYCVLVTWTVYYFHQAIEWTQQTEVATSYETGDWQISQVATGQKGVYRKK